MSYVYVILIKFNAENTSDEIPRILPMCRSHIRVY